MTECLFDTVRAVVFDLDDTLYPEQQYVRSGLRAVAGHLAGPEHGIDEVYNFLWQQFEHGDRRRVFNTTLTRIGRPDDEQVIAELVGLYRCHRPALHLDDATERIIRELRRRGYRLGLLTDGYLPAQRLKVEALQLQDRLDHIIYTEQLGREFWKPHTRAFEMMGDFLACTGQQCVYVADNPAKDFIAPAELGWHSVRVQLPQGLHRDCSVPPADEAQTQIGELAELLALLPG